MRVHTLRCRQHKATRDPAPPKTLALLAAACACFSILTLSSSAQAMHILPAVAQEGDESEGLMGAADPNGSDAAATVATFAPDVAAATPSSADASSAATGWFWVLASATVFVVFLALRLAHTHRATTIRRDGA